MRILFAGKQHFETGGIDRNTDQLGRRLLGRGHDVAVVASPFSGSSRSRVRSATGLEPVPGWHYPAWVIAGASPAQGLAELLPVFRPDVVVVNAGSAWFHDWTRPLVKRARGVVPSVLYIHDVAARALVEEPSMQPDMIWACADTHANAVRATGHDAVTIPPLVEPDLYRVQPTGDVVLYVNPVKVKGVRTAITLAAMRRDIPFVFLRSWNVPDGYARELQEFVSHLGNVEIAVPVPDVREYYARARVLLAPYDDQSRPRVVTEAQISGIPVLAYDDEAFQEAVGGGGLLVRSDAPMTAWLGALNRLWDDADEHRRLSAAALTHSQRPDANPENIIALAEDALAEAVERFHAHHHRRRTADPVHSPLVSVILPARDAADTIGEQLEALSRQTYGGAWELIVSDNGSTDGTRGRVVAWEGAFAATVRIVDASGRRGVAHARNVGVAAANGEYILICDADDVVSRQWIESMVGALDAHEIVTGCGERRLLNTADQYEWMGEADQVDAETSYGFLRYASGGNLGVRREVASALGGFDETLMRAEDIDWSWRAHYAGYDVQFEPTAVIHYRYRSDPKAIARSWFRAGVAEPLLYRRHRSRGMQAESRAQVADVWRWVVDNARAARTHPELQHRWIANTAQRAGRVVGSIRHRALFL